MHRCKRLRTGLVAAALQKTNYANWFSYYRKREYVAKRALSQIIKNSSSRVGLSTLHNNNSVRTLVADVDDVSTPVNATARANKNYPAGQRVQY